MCSPKLHVEVNGFGLKKKRQADLMCKSNQRHLEPTLEYETTLPSPTNLKERIKMRSMHLYQTFSGIPTPTPAPTPTPPHPPPPHTHTHTHTHTPFPSQGMSETYMFRYKCGKLQICNVCLQNQKNITHLIIS